MASHSLALLRLPGYPAAFAGLLFAILGQAMAGSYMTLLAVERAGMNPIQLTFFLTASAISGIAINTWFGRRLDQRAERWPLLVSLIAGVGGYFAIAVITDPLVLTLLAFTLVGLSTASFTLLFGIAKGYLNRTDPLTASAGMAALRMNTSLAWAVGPALGALCVWLWSYPGVFLGAGICGFVALAIALLGRLTPLEPLAAPPGATESLALWRLALPTALALTLFHTAMFMGSNAMSIVTVGEAGGNETDVGLIFSLCAAIEVVVMGLFVLRPAKRVNKPLLVAGYAIFAAYFVVVMLFPSLITLYWAQIFRAVGIAIVSIVGMMVLQEAMPTRPGAAAALFSNATNVSVLVSGLGTGTWAAAFGYWSIFGLSAALAISAGLITVVTRVHSRREASPSSTLAAEKT